MRRDIAKVVFERPRASKTPRPARVVLDQSGEHLDEASSHVHRGRRKSRNANRSPSEHFLFCRVGKLRGRVWGEVCAAAGARIPLGAEIRTRVDCLVDTGCRLERRARGCYVHPRSGLLRHAREEG